MPYVLVQMLSGRSKEVKAGIAKDVTEALHKHAGTSPDGTMVVFQDVERDSWASGGALLSDK